MYSQMKELTDNNKLHQQKRDGQGKKMLFDPATSGVFSGNIELPNLMGSVENEATRFG